MGGVPKPRSIISFLENRVAALEIELENIKSGSGEPDSLEEAFAAVENLTSRVAAGSAQPWTSCVHGKRDGKDETTFGSLKSSPYLSRSPIPESGDVTGQFVSEEDGQVDEQSPRSTNIVSIPRHVIDIMLKNYCDIYLPQYPALEAEELYESCTKIYTDDRPSHFDYFSVAITLAISVSNIQSSRQEKPQAHIMLGKHFDTA